MRPFLWVGAVLSLVVGLCLFEYLRLPDAAPLAKENPKRTALMEAREEEALAVGKKARHRQRWVALEAVPRSTVDAVLLAEDAAFYQHQGIDTVEMKKALGEAWEKKELGRGASTLTQQLAKNLWLSTDRSLWRKAQEVILARRLEQALSKRRILTLYLNVVEWGDGVWGVEAAALEHFGVRASALSPAQSALLAAMLPAPRKRLPRFKSKALHRHASRILSRMEATRRLTPGAALHARRELDVFFGVKLPKVAVDAELEEAELDAPLPPDEAAPPVPVAPSEEIPEEISKGAPGSP